MVRFWFARPRSCNCKKCRLAGRESRKPIKPRSLFIDLRRDYTNRKTACMKSYQEAKTRERNVFFPSTTLTAVSITWRNNIHMNGALQLTFRGPLRNELVQTHADHGHDKPDPGTTAEVFSQQPDREEHQQQFLVVGHPTTLGKGWSVRRVFGCTITGATGDNKAALRHYRALHK